MRILLAIVLLLGVFTASAQKNKFKGAGFDYTKTAPNYIPVRGTESEIAIDSLTGKWMQYSYQDAAWWHLGYFVTETGTSGSPSYTPNKVKSVMAINAGDSLYHYRAGTWYLIAGGGGAGITDGDKGDVDVTGGGAVWTVDAGAITMIKINQAGAAVGQVIKWNGTAWAPANDETSATGAGGIYGPSDLVTYHHTATVDSGLTFSSAEDTAYFNIIMAPGAFGSAAYFNSDSIRLRRYDVGGSNEVILNSDGVLLKTTTPDRFTIQGADARYSADYRATYSDRSLIDKKYGDDFYLQEVDSIRVSNDTLYISLARDSVPEKFVVLPASDDTSGYNLDFRISNDTLYIEDADGALFVDLEPYKDNTDTSGYNLGARISGDTLYIRDGDGEVSVELPSDSDGQTLSIDSVSLESGERFIITISNGNSVSFDVPVDTDNQTLDTFDIVSNILRGSLTDDGIPFKSVDLAPYLDNTDSQNLTVEGSGPTYDIAISGGSDITVQGGGIITLSETPANTLVITGTEVGTVSNFSAGDLSPLFTTSEATTTTTPALTFALTNAGANTYFGNATGSTAAPSYTAAGSLTRTNDTNVTITLGGNPTTSLLRSTSLTLGWTGTLAVSRGGIGVGTLASNGVLYGNGTGAVQALAVNAGTKQFLSQASSGAPSWSSIVASDIGSGAALTKVDDTNVTLTLGGAPPTSLLSATSLTLGWTGQLGVARGGTGASTLTGILQGNGTGAVTGITNSSTTGHVLQVVGASSYAWGVIDSTIIPNGAVSVRDIGQHGASSGQVLKWNGTQWAPGADDTGGAGAGQNNVGENLGAGTGVYAGKTDTTLQFKSLVEGYGIDLSSTGTDITIAADTAQLATLHDVAVVQGDIDSHELADGDLDDTNELQTILIDSVVITGKERFLLEISDGNTVAFDVDLNTDDQTLILDSAIVGSVERFELEVSNGNSVFFDIPQATDTDNQTLDTFEIVSNILRASLTDDGVPFKSVDLSSYLDNTDAQNLSYTASSRSLEISGGTGINIPLFSQFGTNAGLVSGSNTATTNFLRGDNTWQPVITTEVDGSISNEGVLGVGAGSGTSSTLLSTTSGSNAVTINAAGILAITESTSANGGSITLTATEVDGSITNEIQNLTYTAATGVVAIDGTGSTDATIPVMTASVRGLTPDGDGSGTDEFLREDATWGVPPGVTNLTITGSGPTYTIDSNTGTDVIISASGITLSESPANTLVFTAVDASVTNEIQTLDTFEIASNILRASLLNDGVPFKSVDLSSYLDNTDEQDLSIDSVSITGKERFTIDITNGTSVSFDVDINTDTQDLSIDSASTTGGQNFTIGLTDGGSVSLFIPTDTDTDEQTLVLDSTDLTGIERYALGITDGNTVYFDDDDRQTLDTFEIVSNILRASATEDGVPFKSVDLSSYVNPAIALDHIAIGTGTSITQDYAIQANRTATDGQESKIRLSMKGAGITDHAIVIDSVLSTNLAYVIDITNPSSSAGSGYFFPYRARYTGSAAVDLFSALSSSSTNSGADVFMSLGTASGGGDPAISFSSGVTNNQVIIGVDNSSTGDLFLIDYLTTGWNMDGTYALSVNNGNLVGIRGAPVTGKALAITGELAISDLNASTTATVVLGADGSGNVESLGLSGLSVSSGTLTATDPSLSNEGTLGVSAGASNTSVITSNTSGATGVTVTAGIAMTISESTSSNGGTITLNADTTILATIHDVAVSGGTDTNIYTTDGDIKAGGTILDASGNDGLYFLVDNAATADDYVIRMAADYAADDAITHWLHTTTGTDSLDIYSYDDGLYMKWEGTSGAGEGFTISSNTILNLTADSVRVQSLPARTTLPFMVGLQGNTLSKIEGATDGQVLVWDETNGGFWEIGTSAGADGNGIYDGSDIIPDGTIATIESGGAFTFDYDGGADAIKFDDATGYVRITDKTGSSQLQVLGTAALVQGDGQSSVVGGGNSLTINEDQFVFTADTGTVRLTLFEPSGSGTNYTMFTQPAMAASQIYALPVDAPSDGEVLTWNTTGQLSWETAGGGSGDIINGGNTTGATVVIGTNDAQALSFETNNVVRTTITGGASTGGVVTLSPVVSNTTTVADVLMIDVTSSGSSNDGFGAAIKIAGENEGGTLKDMARISTNWEGSLATEESSFLDFDVVTLGGSLTKAARVSGNSGGQIVIGASTPVTLGATALTPTTSFGITSGSTLLITSSASSTSALRIGSSENTGSSTASISVGAISTYTQTSNTRNVMTFGTSFAPTSGTATHNRLAFTSTINQTGGASGQVTAVLDSSVLTSVANYTSFKTVVNTANAKGFVQTGASSSNNFVGGSAFGTTSAPNASAQIDIVSTTKGLGMPAMTDAQMNAIGSPREGLTVYSTDQDALMLRDNGIFKRLPTTRTVLKTADETVNNSSTYQADDHLVFTAKANKKYVVKYYLYVEDVAFNASNGAMKLKITAPSATTLRYGATGGAGLAAAYGDNGTDITVTDIFGSTPSEGFVILTAYINPGASDRTVTLEWAQITADASDTKLLEGSFMEYEEIN